MPFEFGDVVPVPFPFTSQTASKKRPAVVVSNGAYSATRSNVIVMAITSQPRPQPRFGRDVGQRLAGGGAAQAFGGQTGRPTGRPFAGEGAGTSSLWAIMPRIASSSMSSA
jgi:PemK-like, MazF-like toxin of type II toxin-antitoxin system